MQTWRCGEAAIQRIEELTGPMFDPHTFFPDFDPAVLERHRGWLRPVHVHESGRINVSMHSWLIRLPEANVLVDTCIGDGKDRHPFHRWSDLATGWLDALGAAGVAPEDVDYVMCTHLHVDHVGWNTRRAGNRWVPTFPNARYLFARGEVEFWRSRREAPKSEDFERVADKVWDDSVQPVLEAGQAELVAGRHAFAGGRLEIEPAPGHTPGSCTLAVRGEREEALCSGDVVHHPLQVVEPDWNSAFCELPDDARATRRALLARCAERGTLLLPAHFAAPHAAGIEARADGEFRPRFVPPQE